MGDCGQHKIRISTVTEEREEESEALDKGSFGCGLWVVGSGSSSGQR